MSSGSDWLPVFVAGPITAAVGWGLSTISRLIQNHRAEERAADLARIAEKDAIDAAFRKQVENFIREQAELNRKRDIEIAEIRVATKLGESS